MEIVEEVARVGKSGVAAGNGRPGSAERRLRGVQHEAVVQVRPGLADLVAALEHDVRDAAPRQLARRRQTRRAGADHEDVVESVIDRCAHSVFRYSISARRFASVRIRGQTVVPDVAASRAARC